MSKASETKDKHYRPEMGEQTLSGPQTVIIHHLIILIPLWLSVQLSVETMTYNTTITSHSRTL